MSKAQVARIKARQSYSAVQDQTWVELEATLGGPLNPKLREKIDEATRWFVVGMDATAKDKVIKVTDAIAAIDIWEKSSQALYQTLGSKSRCVTFMKRNKLNRALKQDKMKKRMKTWQPLRYLKQFVRVSIQAAEIAKAELASAAVVLDRNDIWFVWVRLLAVLLKNSGFKVTSTSTDKGERESAFPKAINCLQQALPRSCRKRQAYGSIARGVSTANGKFDGLNEDELFDLLRTMRVHMRVKPIKARKAS